MAEKQDFYEILGVDRSVSQEDIKKAYRNLALKYHPDRIPNDKAAEQHFKEISQAYDVLSDPEKRRQYDQFGHDGLRGYATRDFGSFEDIFSAFSDVFGEESFFGDFFGIGRRRRGPGRGASLRVELEVEFKEAAFGCEKRIELWRRETCEDCGGNGAARGSSPETCPSCRGRGSVMRNAGFFSVEQPCPSCGGRGSIVRNACRSCRGEGAVRKKREITVRIPSGIQDSTRLRMGGEGEPSADGGPRGDLYCDVFVRPHSFFERHGNDIVCEMPVSFAIAALGGEVEVPTLEGSGRLKIPRGTPSGQLLRMRSAGVPPLNGGPRGDQIVRVVVEVPKKVTKRQEELLREFADLEQQGKGKKNLWEKFFGEP